MFKTNYYSADVPFERQPYVFMHNTRQRQSFATLFDRSVVKSAKAPMTVTYSFKLLRLM